MALRLQSNLLWVLAMHPCSMSIDLYTSIHASYGVARVYSQQCGYILSDAQAAQSNMRILLEAVRTAELDPNAGRAR